MHLSNRFRGKFFINENCGDLDHNCNLCIFVIIMQTEEKRSVTRLHPRKVIYTTSLFNKPELFPVSKQLRIFIFYYPVINMLTGIYSYKMGWSIQCHCS